MILLLRFPVRCSRGKMYIGYGHLCVCLSIITPYFDLQGEAVEVHHIWHLSLVTMCHLVH